MKRTFGHAVLWSLRASVPFEHASSATGVGPGVGVDWAAQARGPLTAQSTRKSRACTDSILVPS